MKHLIAVGACYLDTILSIPHFPQEDAKLRATTLHIRRGGNGSNTLQVLQQLLGAVAATPSSSSSVDLALHLLTTLPNRDCPATAQVLTSFDTSTSSGIRPVAVDCSRSLFRPDQTACASCYVLHSQATGSRTIVNYSGLAEMTVEEFVRVADDEQFVAAEETWWHFEGRIPETTFECIHHLRRHHPTARISVEVEKPAREGLRALAREADVVFYSRSWAEGEGYESAEACLTGEVASTPRASLLLCTWGARGASALWPRMTMTTSREEAAAQVLSVEPTQKNVHVVDAVGAGDTFVAGVLYGVLCRVQHDQNNNGHGAQTVRFAVDLATAKVQQDGFAGLGLVAAAML